LDFISFTITTFSDCSKYIPSLSSAAIVVMLRLLVRLSKSCVDPARAAPISAFLYLSLLVVLPLTVMRSHLRHPSREGGLLPATEINGRFPFYVPDPSTTSNMNADPRFYFPFSLR